MIDEGALRAASRWTRVGDVPGLPVETFEEVRDLTLAHVFTIGVDHSAARRLGPAVRGSIGNLWNTLLMCAPFVVPVVSVAAAIWLRKPLLLLGVPIALVTFFLAGPVHPGKRGCMTALGAIAALALTISLVTGSASLAWLLAFFVVPLLAVRLYYEGNAMALRRALLGSEALFLYVYERRGCTVRDNRDGRIYYAGSAAPS